MATTLTIQNSINFAMPILKNQPLLVSNHEPAITAGNMVLGMMLGAPLKWRFNRANASFAITAVGLTDYVETLSNFGFIDMAWLVDGSGKTHGLTGRRSLAKATASGRPEFISAQYDDNAGNITFRMDKVPDQNYTVNIDYQQKAALLTSAASTWGTVPDEFQYIFNWGFLAFISLLINDARFPVFNQFFISRILGAQDGLSVEEKNIFIGNWLALLSTEGQAQQLINSGVASKQR